MDLTRLNEVIEGLRQNRDDLEELITIFERLSVLSKRRGRTPAWMKDVEAVLRRGGRRRVKKTDQKPSVKEAPK